MLFLLYIIFFMIPNILFIMYYGNVINIFSMNINGNVIKLHKGSSYNTQEVYYGNNYDHVIKYQRMK